MNIFDFYLLFGFSVPAPDFIPDFTCTEQHIEMNYDRRGDARPSDDDSDGIQSEVFKL